MASLQPNVVDDKKNGKSNAQKQAHVALFPRRKLVHSEDFAWFLIESTPTLKLSYK